MAKAKPVVEQQKPKSNFQRQADKYDELTQQLAAFCRYWQHKMALQHWHFDIFYMGDRWEENPDAQAVIKADTVYQQAVLRFFLPNLVEIDTLELDEVVAHEMTHCYTNNMLLDPTKEMTTAERMALERMTTSLARALIRVKYENSSGKKP